MKKPTPTIATARDIDPIRRPAYRPSLAMRIAAQRASVQPPLIAAVTRVDNYRGLPENKRRGR